MFQRLQKKWNVSTGRFILIFIVFALGGSATGYTGKRLMSLLDIQSTWVYVPVYVVVVTLIWPLMVLLISIPFGQFNFFRAYIIKLGSRIANRRRPKPSESITHIAIFASGAGSNAQKIIDHFRNHQYIKVSLIACNKPGAGVISIAEREGIPVLLIERERFVKGDGYAEALQTAGIGFIALAGFLWKIPQKLIDAYRNRIVNIHPALLPKFGGKGFYGQFVHESVINAGEKESGITIHYVDEEYDHGDNILQKKVQVEAHDTPATLARKVQQLEHQWFPKVIEELVKKQNRS